MTLQIFKPALVDFFDLFRIVEFNLAVAAYSNSLQVLETHNGTGAAASCQSFVADDGSVADKVFTCRADYNLTVFRCIA